MHSRSRWRLRTAHSNIEEDVPPFYDAMAEEYAAYEEEEAKQQAAASNFLDEFPE